MNSVYTAEQYAGLSRKVRRSLRKADSAPETVLPATQQPVRFTDRSPARAYPSTFYWWKRGYAVAAHVFSACPRLFRDWAGQDFHTIRTGTARQAHRHTQGMCQHCLLRWQLGFVA